MQDSADQVEYVIIVPVWGSTYVERFLDYSLPSWMAPGNLPVLAELSPKVFFFSNEASFPNLSKDPNVIKLSSFAKIEYVFIPPESLRKNNDAKDGESQRKSTFLLTGFENHILTHYKDRIGNVGFFSLRSDHFYADGAFRTILNNIKAGKRAVMGTSLRVSEGGLDTQLMAKKQLSQDGASVTTIPPRELARMALPHIHPLERARTMGETISTVALSRIYWRLPDGGLYGPSMEFAPFYFRPRRFSLITDYLGKAGEGLIDYVFSWTMGLDQSEYAFLLDSDDFFNISMEHPLKFSENISQGELTAGHIAARLLDGWVGPYQYEMLQRHRVSFHCDDLPGNIGDIDNDINRILLLSFTLAMIKISLVRISNGKSPSGT